MYKQINQVTSSRTLLESAALSNQYSPHYYLSPQVGLGMRRKLRSTFIRYEGFPMIWRGDGEWRCSEQANVSYLDSRSTFT